MLTVTTKSPPSCTPPSKKALIKTKLNLTGIFCKIDHSAEIARVFFIFIFKSETQARMFQNLIPRDMLKLG